ncbi:MAG: hypothetical protein IPM98_06395 [Lewinellaceae bacterium]|nr:hypothetical protein [Lewinellaceae bacterium]
MLNFKGSVFILKKAALKICKWKKRHIFVPWLRQQQMSMLVQIEKKPEIVLGDR